MAGFACEAKARFPWDGGGTATLCRAAGRGPCASPQKFGAPEEEDDDADDLISERGWKKQRGKERWAGSQPSEIDRPTM